MGKGRMKLERDSRSRSRSSSEKDMLSKQQLERDVLAKQKSIASLRAAINKAKEELGNAVAGHDFIKAGEVKTTLDGLEKQVVVAEEELRVLKEKKEVM